MKFQFLLFITLVLSYGASAESIDIGLPNLERFYNAEPLRVEETNSNEVINKVLPKKIPLTHDCIYQAAQFYRIHPDILYAILLVEGGTVGEGNSGNQNGSTDFNLFQINSIHLPELAELGITKEEVINDGCLSAAIAARIVYKATLNIRIENEDEYLSAIARYHSANPGPNQIYSRKLKAAFQYLQGDRDSPYVK